jgi:pimeloyl-ACP methyl ester carboxylesterase
MTLSRGSVMAMLVCGILSVASSVEAAPLNDRSCKPAGGKDPVVLVHGQGGNVEGMTAISGALAGAGYCVFGMNYGQETPGGLFGRARLDVSGKQIADFVQGVLKDTGATKVNVVGHSAGMGALDNFILLHGGGGQVANAVSFGGLHHPYAHLGLANVIDTNVFLPNSVAAVQGLLPPFTSNVRFQDLAVGVLGLGSSVGLKLPPREHELVTSGFVSDLFDPQYWVRLHGGLSEPPGVFVSINASERTLKTKDSAPNICYTNIVGVADFITGANAGFQDPAPNVENFVLTSLADHVQMISDPAAIDKMIGGLAKTCEPGDGDGEGPVPDGPYH